ncbi:uncharacterized protein LOC117301612 [Asterias rubens]|uniref:uncharacterized protein LOC117301612 n=1 Tax=Asterias rubens TaxID=7604 RepID=UPI0014550D36|nr:uncharacterized protein LOC117301612 [Asterias rubens]
MVIVISLIVVALRLHKKRYSAIPASQTNVASTASVTFRAGHSQGNAHTISLIQPNGGEQDARSFHADTAASVDLNLSASPPASLIDNHKVIQHYDSGNGVMYTSVNREKRPQASAAPYTGVTRGATAIKYQPKKVARPGELVYADLQHTRHHPPNAPPIRTEPPTQYAAISHNMTRALHRDISTPAGHYFDSDEEVEQFMVGLEDEAPPPPPRGIFVPPVFY